MKKHWNRQGFPILFTLLLTIFTVFALLDTFVIPHSYSAAATTEPAIIGKTAATETIEAEDTEPAENETADGAAAAAETTDPSARGSRHHKHPGADTASEAESTAESTGSTASASVSESGTSYTSDSLTITLNQYLVADTTVYVADVVTDDPSRLKTALAGDVYGRNVTDKPSSIASDSGAVLAINGDFYGARTSGYVIRNGVLYRDTASGGEDLVIWADGSFSIIDETRVSAQELLDQGAVQVLSFGPALVEDGQVSVSETDEVGKAMASNPRTAIGIVDEGHYLFVVSDGRTSESEGLTLRELADFMESLGVQTAYNLDGGGSSTMVFQGQVENNPTTGGSTIRERSVSDIVYVS